MVLECKSEFICPSTKVGLNASCGLNTCGYYANNSWVKNCVLYYMLATNQEKLSIEEVSFLYKIPKENLDNMYNEQLTKIRKKELTEALKDKNKITYIESIPVCCVCETKISGKLHIIEGLTYCSRKCLRTRPPYIARIEREYSSDILTIFHTVFNKFKNLSSVESVLNISRNKIEFILNNYVRGLLSKFMSLIDNNELFSIINRNNPKCENILEKMDKNKFQFGQPTKSIKNLYLELCEIF